MTVGKEPVYAADQDVFNAIAGGVGDFHNAVYLPLEAKPFVGAKRQPEARILAKDFKPMRQKIDVETPGDAMLVVNEAYYHNWTVQVDGKPARLWRANYAFDAVEVPTGRHEVLFVYRDEAFRAGAMISLCALLFCVAGWVLAGKSVATD